MRYRVWHCAAQVVSDHSGYGMSHELSGRKALVTGATRGIGFAIAARLATEGAAVVGTGRGSTSSGPDGCDYVSVDLADRDAFGRFLMWATSQEFDILVNNAGINVVSPFGDIDDNDYDQVLEVNLRAPMALCRAVVPGMCVRSWGRVVNITSIFSVVSKAARGAYSSSKFGLVGMTAALSAEVARCGVLANCVAPGFIDTELTRQVLGKDGIADMVADVPAGRLGTPEEVAELAVWLAGPRNTFMSGQNVVIDGGFTRV
jgi:NAD(P)-dependent dehydrogenase (short-subunit alcohol dehydrogenase family)